MRGLRDIEIVHREWCAGGRKGAGRYTRCGRPVFLFAEDGLPEGFYSVKGSRRRLKEYYRPPGYAFHMWGIGLVAAGLSFIWYRPGELSSAEQRDVSGLEKLRRFYRPPGYRLAWTGLLYLGMGVVALFFTRVI